MSVLPVHAAPPTTATVMPATCRNWRRLRAVVSVIDGSPIGSGRLGSRRSPASRDIEGVQVLVGRGESRRGAVEERRPGRALQLHDVLVLDADAAGCGRVA